MNSGLSKREINCQRWREQINAWQQSGQTQKMFCQQQRLGLASFQRWRRIFETEENSSNPPPVAFLPVSMKETNPANLTVVVNDNLRIEIPAGFDPNALRQIIEVLRAS